MNSELLFLYALVFPYIFLLFDCFELALIDCIVKCKVHSVLWQLQVGGQILRFTRVNLKIWAHLPFDALLHRRSFRITYKRPNEGGGWQILFFCADMDILSVSSIIPLEGNESPTPHSREGWWIDKQNFSVQIWTFQSIHSVPCHKLLIAQPTIW